MARMCQLKHEIVRFNPRIRTDYISVEELLIDLKLTPAQLEVPIPHYFREGMCGVRKKKLAAFWFLLSPYAVTSAL